VGALALAAATPFAIDQARDLRQDGSTARERDQARQDLDAVARRAGGRAGVTACGNPAITRGGLQGQLAWRLDLSLEQVERPDPPAKPLSIRLPGVLFDDKLERPVPMGVGPGLRTEPLAQTAGWRVLSVTGAGGERPAGCRPAAGN